MNKAKLQIIVCSIAAASITWYLNHTLGYGAVIANGIVGVVAAILLPASLAGAAYTASFVGMSGALVLPALPAALLGGLIVGIVLAYTTEIYAGIGGKGGTTAAFSTLLTKFIWGLLG